MTAMRLDPLQKAPRRLFATAAGLPLLVPMIASANPSGGEVAAGQVSFSNPDANTLQVDQTSDTAIINWESFSIAGNETVIFSQPSASAAVLNRVLSGSPSEILGTMTANGRVFIVNPLGVLFGEGATVDVGGLVATTLDIADDDFLAGNYVFTTSQGNDAAVANLGTITSSGGFIVIAAPQAINAGTIMADSGQVLLASADGITLQIDGTGLVGYSLDLAAISELAQVENAGQILAAGGVIALDASVVAASLPRAVVNQTGSVSAAAIDTGDDGSIILRGAGGHVNHSGTLDAGTGTVEITATDGAVVGGGDAIAGEITVETFGANGAVALGNLTSNASRVTVSTGGDLSVGDISVTHSGSGSADVALAAGGAIAFGAINQTVVSTGGSGDIGSLPHATVTLSAGDGIQGTSIDQNVTAADGPARGEVHVFSGTGTIAVNSIAAHAAASGGSASMIVSVGSEIGDIDIGSLAASAEVRSGSSHGATMDVFVGTSSDGAIAIDTLSAAADNAGSGDLAGAFVNVTVRGDAGDTDIGQLAVRSDAQSGSASALFFGSTGAGAMTIGSAALSAAVASGQFAQATMFVSVQDGAFHLGAADIDAMLTAPPPDGASSGGAKVGQSTGTPTAIADINVSSGGGDVLIENAALQSTASGAANANAGMHLFGGPNGSVTVRASTIEVNLDGPGGGSGNTADAHIEIDADQGNVTIESTRVAAVAGPTSGGDAIATTQIQTDSGTLTVTNLTTEADGGAASAAADLQTDTGALAASGVSVQASGRDASATVRLGTSSGGIEATGAVASATATVGQAMADMVLDSFSGHIAFDGLSVTASQTNGDGLATARLDLLAGSSGGAMITGGNAAVTALSEDGTAGASLTARSVTSDVTIETASVRAEGRSGATSAHADLQAAGTLQLGSSTLPADSDALRVDAVGGFGSAMLWAGGDLLVDGALAVHGGESGAIDKQTDSFDSTGSSTYPGQGASPVTAHLGISAGGAVRIRDGIVLVGGALTTPVATQPLSLQPTGTVTGGQAMLWASGSTVEVGGNVVVDGVGGALVSIYGERLVDIAGELRVDVIAEQLLDSADTSSLVMHDGVAEVYIGTYSGAVSTPSEFGFLQLGGLDVRGPNAIVELYSDIVDITGPVVVSALAADAGGARYTRTDNGETVVDAALGAASLRIRSDATTEVGQIRLGDAVQVSGPLAAAELATAGTVQIAGPLQLNASGAFASGDLAAGFDGFPAPLLLLHSDHLAPEVLPPRLDSGSLSWGGALLRIGGIDGPAAAIEAGDIDVAGIGAVTTELWTSALQAGDITLDAASRGAGSLQGTAVLSGVHIVSPDGEGQYTVTQQISDGAGGAASFSRAELRIDLGAGGTAEVGNLGVSAAEAFIDIAGSGLQFVGGTVTLDGGALQTRQRVDSHFDAESSGAPALPDAHYQRENLGSALVIDPDNPDPAARIALDGVTARGRGAVAVALGAGEIAIGGPLSIEVLGGGLLDTTDPRAGANRLLMPEAGVLLLNLPSGAAVADSLAITSAGTAHLAGSLRTSGDIAIDAGGLSTAFTPEAFDVTPAAPLISGVVIEGGPTTVSALPLSLDAGGDLHLNIGSALALSGASLQAAGALSLEAAGIELIDSTIAGESVDLATSDGALLRIAGSQLSGAVQLVAGGARASLEGTTVNDPGSTTPSGSLRIDAEIIEIGSDSLLGGTTVTLAAPTAIDIAGSLLHADVLDLQAGESLVATDAFVLGRQIVLSASDLDFARSEVGNGEFVPADSLRVSAGRFAFSEGNLLANSQTIAADSLTWSQMALIGEAVAIEVGGDADIVDAHLTAGTLGLQAGNANLVGTVVEASGAVSINGGTLNLDEFVLTGGSIDLRAGDSLVIRDAVVEAQAALNAQAADLRIEIADLEAGSDLRLAGEVLNLTRGTLLAGAALDIAATAISAFNVGLAGERIALTADVASWTRADIAAATLTMGGGALSLDDVTIQAPTVDVDLARSLDTSEVTGVSNVVTLRAGNILLGPGTQIGAADAVEVVARSGDLLLQGASVFGTGDATATISLQASGALLLDASIVRGGAVRLVSGSSGVTPRALTDAERNAGPGHIIAADSTIDALSLSAQASRRIDFSRSSLRIGTGIADFGLDGALVAQIRASNPDLVPVSAGPNAALRAPEIALGSLAMAGDWLFLQTDLLRFAGPIQASDGLFVNLRPTADAGPIRLAQSGSGDPLLLTAAGHFNALPAGTTVALGGSGQSGAIAVTQPGLDLGDRGLNIVLATSGPVDGSDRIRTDGAVVVLGRQATIVDEPQSQEFRPQTGETETPGGTDNDPGDTDDGRDHKDRDKEKDRERARRQRGGDETPAGQRRYVEEQTSAKLALECR